MRYLAIIQVKPKSGASTCQAVSYDEASHTYSVGDWNINAEMNAAIPARIQVSNAVNSAAMTSGGSLILNGKTYKGKRSGSSKLIEVINGKEVFQGLRDEIPAVMSNFDLSAWAKFPLALISRQIII